MLKEMRARKDSPGLSAEGVPDFNRFRVDPTVPLALDLFIDPRQQRLTLPHDARRVADQKRQK